MRPPVVAALTDPAIYPHAVDRVELIETHISWVFLAGERVYKVKKPVNLGFLDFTTLERRRFFCEEEVRLNRRLTRDVYLGVVPVCQTADGQFTLTGDGNPVDWLVKMRRLDEARRLDVLLAQNALTSERLSELADHLAQFDARTRIKACRRFVEDQHRGIVDHGAAEGQALLHAL